MEYTAYRIVLDNADKIVNLLKEKQLGEGKYYDGSIIGTYSKYTQRYSDEGDPSKAITSKPYGEPYNFQWTGNFFKEMYLQAYVDAPEFDIFSRDGKVQALKDAYGEDLLKLSEENNDWINENIIAPELVKHIEENWFLIE